VLEDRDHPALELDEAGVIPRTGPGNVDLDAVDGARRTAADDEHAVGEVGGLEGVVRDEHDRLSELRPDAHQLVAHAPRRQLVEAAERLVHQQHVGLDGKGAGDGGPLLHADRQRQREGPLEARQPDQAQVVGDDLGPPGLGHLAGGQSEGEVVLDGAPVEETRTLEDVAPLRRPSVFGAVEQDLAAVGVGQPGEDVQGRRLAAARRADEAGELTVADLEAETVEHVQRSAVGPGIALAKVANDDARHR
jgi:hypothetical protein